MQVKDIFYNNIDRDITTVIKVDDHSSKEVIQEIQEFVVTGTIESNIIKFFEEFNSSKLKPTDKIGVWLSGFFGSGKSHFAKLISYLLENKSIENINSIDEFLLKVGGSINESDIKALLHEIKSYFDNKTIIFQIKSEEDQLNKDSISEIIYRQFLKSKGLSTNLQVARMEEELILEGKYEEFKAEILKTKNKPWDEARKLQLFVRKDIARILVKIMPEQYNSEEEALKAFDDLKDNISLEPAKLAEELARYIDNLQKKNNQKHMKLIFIIDEMGQFIGDNDQKLLELQSIVEQFSVKGKGKLWLIVTAQEKLEDIIEGVKRKAVDFSKIKDRFNIRLELTSENIEKVIEERILKKKNNSIYALEEKFNSYEGNIVNIATMKNANRALPECEKDIFIKTYPFLPSQLFIIPNIFSSIRSKGGHQKQLTGSERSMLGVTQGILKSSHTDFKNSVISRIVAYNEIYDQIESEIDSSIRREINDVENRIKFEKYSLTKILKALFLIQQITWIPRNLDNITKLLITKIDEDFGPFKNIVAEGLNKLMDGKYVIEQDGQYEFITGAKKEIEEAIASETVKSNEKRIEIKKYLKTLFKDISRVQYDGIKYFSLKIIGDNEELNSKGDIVIKIYSPLEVQYGDVSKETCLKQSFTEINTIYWIAKENIDIDKNIDKLLRTEYVVAERDKKQIKSEEEISILREKKKEIDNLKNNIDKLLQSGFCNGIIIFNGDEEELEGKVAKIDTITLNIVSKMIPHVYTKFCIGKYKVNEKNITYLLDPKKKDLSTIEPELKLFDNSGQINLHSPVINEVIEELKKRINGGYDIDGKTMVDYFESIPYGWESILVRIVLATLFRSSNISLKFEGKIYNDYKEVKASELIINSKTFNKTEFIYETDDELSLNDRQEAQSYLDNIFDYKGDDTSNSMSKALIEKLDKINTDYNIQKVHVNMSKLPVTNIFYDFEKITKDITNFKRPNKIIQAFLQRKDALQKLIKYLYALHDFIEIKNTEPFKNAVELMQSVKDVLHCFTNDEKEPIKFGLDEMRAIIENKKIVESWSDFNKEYNKLLNIYQNKYSTLHEQRTGLYNQMINEIQCHPDYTKLPEAFIKDELSPYSNNLCDLKLPQFGIKCSLCNRSINELLLQINVVDNEKNRIIKKILIESEKIVEETKDKSKTESDHIKPKLTPKIINLQNLTKIKKIKNKEDIQTVIENIRQGLENEFEDGVTIILS